MKMNYLNYADNRKIFKDLGVNFEHQARTCSIMLDLPNNDAVSLGLMLSLHDRLERNLLDLTPPHTYCLSEIIGGIHWASLTEIQKMLAPKCVDYLIEHHDFPLIRNDDFRAPHVSMYRKK